MVGTAHIGAALHMAETQIKSNAPQQLKALGRNVLLHRKVSAAGRQILPNTEVLTTGVEQVPEYQRQLRLPLPHSQHDTGLDSQNRIP